MRGWASPSNEELERFVSNLAAQLRAGVRPEEPKLEYKGQWPNLREKNGQMEFLKDLVAMANTPGPTGYIIYGLDESGLVTDGSLQQSGLKDWVEVHQMVVKHVDHPVTFEPTTVFPDGSSTPVSVLVVPPSLEKPHVIRLWVAPKGEERQNYIPIRKASGIFPASKSDIEFMLYDRKNVEPDYALDILAFSPHVAVNLDLNQALTFRLPVALQNYGKRPVAIVSGELEVVRETLVALGGTSFMCTPQELLFDLESYEDIGVVDRAISPRAKFIVVPSNSIQSIFLNFRLRTNRSAQGLSSLRDGLRELGEIRFRIALEAVTGQRFGSSDLSGLTKV